MKHYLQILGGVLAVLIFPNLILSIWGVWEEHLKQVWATHVVLLAFVAFIEDKL